jgi:hypothetical protein
MDSAAFTGIDRHTWTIGQTAIVAARAVSRNAGLGTVIDGVRISRSRHFAGKGISKWSTADALVVSAARWPTTFVGNPGVSVIVGIGRQAATIR